MTREEIKKMLPILQAFVDGKTIESRCIKGDKSLWYDDEDPSFDNDFEYRIKPESRYRSFKDAEECWQEMLKHQPFGWVIGKCEKKILITEVLTFGINLHRQESPYRFEEANRILTFSDGVPFGVKVEE